MESNWHFYFLYLFWTYNQFDYINKLIALKLGKLHCHVTTLVKWIFRCQQLGLTITTKFHQNLKSGFRGEFIWLSLLPELWVQLIIWVRRDLWTGKARRWRWNSPINHRSTLALIYSLNVRHKIINKNKLYFLFLFCQV